MAHLEIATHGKDENAFDGWARMFGITHPTVPEVVRRMAELLDTVEDARREIEQLPATVLPTRLLRNFG